MLGYVRNALKIQKSKYQTRGDPALAVACVAWQPPSGLPQCGHWSAFGLRVIGAGECRAACH